MPPAASSAPNVPLRSPLSPLWEMRDQHSMTWRRMDLLFPLPLALLYSMTWRRMDLLFPLPLALLYSRSPPKEWRSKNGGRDNGMAYRRKVQN